MLLPLNNEIDAMDRADIARAERARRCGHPEKLNERCQYNLYKEFRNLYLVTVNEFEDDMVDLLQHGERWDFQAMEGPQLERLYEIISRDDACFIEDPSAAGEWFFTLPAVDANLVAELWAYASFRWASKVVDKRQLENFLNEIILTKFQDVEQYFYESLEFICLRQPMWDDDEHYGYNAYLQPTFLCCPSENEGFWSDRMYQDRLYLQTPTPHL